MDDFILDTVRKYQVDKSFRKEAALMIFIKENIEREIDKKLKSKEIKEIYKLVRSGEIDPYEGAKRVISMIL